MLELPGCYILSDQVKRVQYRIQSGLLVNPHKPIIESLGIELAESVTIKVLTKDFLISHFRPRGNHQVTMHFLAEYLFYTPFLFTFLYQNLIFDVMLLIDISSSDTLCQTTQRCQNIQRFNSSVALTFFHDSRSYSYHICTYSFFLLSALAPENVS